jgi:hypothetical protein
VGRARRGRLIRELEHDASSFWILGAAHITDLARALGVSPDAVRAALFRRGAAS